MNHVASALILSAFLLLFPAPLHCQTATIGGDIYAGNGTVSYTLLINPIGDAEVLADWQTCYAPDPDCPPLQDAMVMVQNQHSGGAFVTWGTVTGNSWLATVPAPGDYIVMFSAPDHDSTSREFTVDPGDELHVDAYLPPLPLPSANLLHYVFFDNQVNGNDDGPIIDPGLNGVTINVYDEEGNLLATGLSGSQSSFITRDGIPFGGPFGIPTDGFYYFTGLPPGEVIVESDGSTVTQAANPHPRVQFANPDDSTRQLYQTYTEEGGHTWDPKLFPGSPGTEDGWYLTWHGFIEKLDNDVGGGTCNISGVILDADGNDPEEPFPIHLGGRVNGGYPSGQDVAPNGVVPEVALALYTKGDFPVILGTTEADPVTSTFEFMNIPIGEYRVFAWDIPLDHVPMMDTEVQIKENCANQSTFPILMPRFFARAQGHVMNGATPVAGARVMVHYKGGSIKQETVSDSDGWFNFDDLPEIEVMGHVRLDLPDKSTIRGKIVTEEFQGGPGGNVFVEHNSMNRYVQWMTYNYYCDIQVESIPQSTGDVNGVVFYDNFTRGSWIGNGVYDDHEDRTLEGVTVELYRRDGGSGPYNVLVATTTSGAFDYAGTVAQGWDEPYTWPPNEIGGVFAGPALGFYEFRDLAPGKYKVRVIPPAGFERSPRYPIKRLARVLAGKSRRVDIGLNSRPEAGNPVGVPLAGEIEGGVFDDFHLDTNVLSLLFEEKAGIIGAPVGVYDHYNYSLGVMYMGNPYCYAGSIVCPTGEPLGQKPEAERRFAAGVHRYVGNDPDNPDHNPAYAPMELPYTFEQGQHKFEADWSLIPLTNPDFDGDGWTTFGLNGVIDCNDIDNTVNPGASETLGDGIDQDCTGLDLQIVITRADYRTADQKLFVWATSSEGAGALGMSAEIAGRPAKDMVWNVAKSRWQKMFAGVSSMPQSVTVRSDSSDPAAMAVTPVAP